jgi:hypothetical protein
MAAAGLLRDVSTAWSPSATKHQLQELAEHKPPPWRATAPLHDTAIVPAAVRAFYTIAPGVHFTRVRLRALSAVCDRVVQAASSAPGAKQFAKQALRAAAEPPQGPASLQFVRDEALYTQFKALCRGVCAAFNPTLAQESQRALDRLLLARFTAPATEAADTQQLCMLGAEVDMRTAMRLLRAGRVTELARFVQVFFVADGALPHTLASFCHALERAAGEHAASVLAAMLRAALEHTPRHVGGALWGGVVITLPVPLLNRAARLLALQAPLHPGWVGPGGRLLIANLGSADDAAVVGPRRVEWLDDRFRLHRAGAPALWRTTDDGSAEAQWFTHGAYKSGGDGVSFKSPVSNAYGWVQHGGTCYMAATLNIVTCCAPLRNYVKWFLAHIAAADPAQAAAFTALTVSGAAARDGVALLPLHLSPELTFPQAARALLYLRLCRKHADPGPLFAPSLINELAQRMTGKAEPDGGFQDTALADMLFAALHLRVQLLTSPDDAGEVDADTQCVLLIAPFGDAAPPTLAAGDAFVAVAALMVRYNPEAETDGEHVVAGFREEGTDVPVVIDSHGSDMDVDWMAAADVPDDPDGRFVWADRTVVYLARDFLVQFAKTQRCDQHVTAPEAKAFQQYLASTAPVFEHRLYPAVAANRKNMAGVLSTDLDLRAAIIDVLTSPMGPPRGK